MTQLESPTQPNPNNETNLPLWILSATLISWLSIALISQLAYLPPNPRPASVENSLFSAGRAEKHLALLVGDGIPHPAGSPQNRIVGDRVRSTMESFGYTVHEQHATRKLGFRRQEKDPDDVPLRNLYSIIDGNKSLGSVMLVAHYDSVPYGPGASDDAVAVAAILEIARMAVTELPPGREIIFLFTDGEEYGLLGADAFVKENELASRVEFVINLEARGTSGGSLMFQTSDDSKQLVSLFADSVRRPFTSSIFEEVYKRLPNDTDFTVFRNDGSMRGFNFAFIGDARKYHTPEDNYDNASRSSMQHHGENAWRLLRTLVALPDLPAKTQKSVYFDVYGRFVMSWDFRYTSVFCLLIVVGLGAVFVLNSNSTLSSKSIIPKFGSIAATIFLLTATAWVLDFSFRIQDRFSPPWVDFPSLVFISFWCLAILSTVLVASLFSAPESFGWKTCWTIWSVLAVLTSIYATGASYLFIIPTLVAITVRILLQHAPLFASSIGSLTAAVFWFPIGGLFYDALGFSVFAVLVLRIILMVLTILPLVQSCSKKNLRQLVWAFAPTTTISILAAVLMNPAN